MPDNKVTVTPIGQRAHWARVHTEFDPPEGDNMQGASEPQPKSAVSPKAKQCGDRLDRAVDEMIAAITLVEQIAVTSSDIDRAFLEETADRCTARFVDSVTL